MIKAAFQVSLERSSFAMNDIGLIGGKAAFQLDSIYPNKFQMELYPCENETE